MMFGLLSFQDSAITNVSFEDVSNKKIVCKQNTHNDTLCLVNSRRFETTINHGACNISSLISRYHFYKYFVGKSLFLVGDVLNSDYYSDQIVEVKLIVSPSLYPFSEYSELSSKQFVLEKITMINDTVMKKEYSFPTYSDVMSLFSVSLKLHGGDSAYGRIITSLNMEADFKASLSSISSVLPLAASVSSAGDFDNQTVLNAYLSSLAESSNDSQILLVRGSDSISTNTVDDDVVSLVPKNVFKNNGQHTQIGSEWGYFANTCTDIGNNKITNLLIFDIFQIKADAVTPDTVAIKTVIHKNYKYNYDFDTVVRDVDNNYAFGNPTYKEGLKYVRGIDDDNGVDNPNPDDGPSYIWQNDNGFAFGSTTAKYVGVGKNFSSGPEDIAKIVFLAGSVGLAVTTSSLTLGAQIAVGAGYSVITDAAINAFFRNEENLDNDDNNGKTIRTSTDIIGADNFESARDTHSLRKLVELRMQDRDGGFDESKPNRSSPLLFKTDSDSINYQSQVISSSGNQSYTAVISHHLHAEIFNDNTWFFKWDPDYVGEINGDWSYIIGKNTKVTAKTISPAGSSVYCVYGTVNDQIVKIKPVISAYYDVVISKIPAYLTASIDGMNYSVTSSASSFTDAWGNSRISAKENHLKLYPYLQGGQEYVVRLSRTNGFSKRVFGTAQINAYLSGDPINRTGSNVNGILNYSWKAISYNGFSINNMFVPLASGLYTVVLSTPSGHSGSIDTYIRILDENFQEIMHDDDGWGQITAGIRMHMQANKSYYIISRLYSATSNGNYEIDVFRQDYLPEFRGTVLTESLPISNLSNRSVSYLVSQSVAKSIVFQAVLDYDPGVNMPNISLTIQKATLETLFSTSDCLHNSVAMQFEANTLYLITLSCYDSRLIGPIRLVWGNS